MIKRFCISSSITWMALVSTAFAQEWTPLTYDPEAAPADNPLKGFIPYVGAYGFPYSMEFNYIGLDDLMSGQNTFTFDAGLEPLLDRIAGRGHQAMIRVFIDYPREGNALPGFLEAAGVNQERYFSVSDGGGLSPDYENETLVAALESFIAAFGARYDGDPRIGFIELGLLGHWGEWHTYPQENLAPSRATQNRVLAAYDAAFDTTKLLVSQDILGYAAVADIAGRDIGFHDDDFANNTLPPGDDQFWSRMLAQGLDEVWTTRVIGGEIQPDFQDVIWDSPSGAPESYAQAIATTHASWMLNHGAFENNWQASERARARAGAKAIGYELFIAEARLAPGAGNVLEAGVRIENRGVAPFYYDWPIELVLVDADGLAAGRFETDWALSGVLPGAEAVEFTTELDAAALVNAEYTVGLRVVNPLANGRWLRFANAEQQDCWVNLGRVTVGGGTGTGLGEAVCTAEAVFGAEGEGEEDKLIPACGAGTPAGWNVADAVLVLAVAGLLGRSMLHRRSREGTR